MRLQEQDIQRRSWLPDRLGSPWVIVRETLTGVIKLVVARGLGAIAHGITLPGVYEETIAGYAWEADGCTAGTGLGFGGDGGGVRYLMSGDDAQLGRPATFLGTLIRPRVVHSRC
jgi:hypothetical protein